MEKIKEKYVLWKWSTALNGVLLLFDVDCKQRQGALPPSSGDCVELQPKVSIQSGTTNIPSFTADSVH